MRKSKAGFPVFSSQDIFDLIYKGRSDIISDLLVEDSDDIKEFNSFSDTQLTIYDMSIEDSIDLATIDTQLQAAWFMPDDYVNMDILEYLISKCSTEQEMLRVAEEYIEYDRRGYIILLKFLKYLVDFMNENKILWGVGRGSSVASYILYLIGIHKIDSIKYDLEFSEFMR